MKFSWNHEDQATSRFWSVFTADSSVRSYYQYKVRVVVKGSIFTKGMEWETDWINNLGNGPLMISVPTPEDEGVIVKREYKKPAAATVTTPSAPPSPAPSGMPPSRGKRAPMGIEQEAADQFTEYTYRSAGPPVHRAIEVKRSNNMPPPMRRGQPSPPEKTKTEEPYEESSFREM